MSDDELLGRIKDLARKEREDTADVIEHLAEVDKRGLWAGLAHSSLFVYCVKELGYEEAAAYHRIRAARAVRKRPELLDFLRSGAMHLRAIVALHPYLDHEKAEGLIAESRGKSRREVEALVAPFTPQPLPREWLRVIAVRQETPRPTDPDGSLFPQSTASPEPTSMIEARVHVSFSAPTVFMERLSRARELCRHKFPEGRLEDLLLAALEALLDKKDPDRRLLARLPRGAARRGAAA